MNFLSKRLGLFSLILGAILTILLFSNFTQLSVLLLILLSIIGVILSAISLVSKKETKWICILGLVLHVYILAYITFLCLALG